MADSGLGQLHPATQKTFFGEADKRLGVRMRTETGSENGVVAGHFALERKARLDEPHGRMKEEDGLEDFLRQVGEVVPTAEVREFVHQDRVELGGWNFGQRPGWEDHHGAEISEGCRNPDGIRGAEGNPTMFSSLSKNGARGHFQLIEVDRGAGGAKTAQAIETVGHVQK